MPKKDAPETSEEIKAQIEEASKDLTFEDIESEETKEAKEGEEETQTEEQETSTEETETPDKEETEEESQPKLYQIKVDGKTEYVTEEKLVEYAQKGRFLERERAKDKTQTKGDEANWEIIDKQIIDKIKTQGFAKTMAEFNAEMLKADKGSMQETRKQARMLADNADWGKEVSLREEFMDRVLTGEDPEIVNIEMSAKYWEGVARKGQAIGGEKERRKQAAQIAKGKETITREEPPSEASILKEYGKLVEEGASSDKLAGVLKKAGVPFPKDDL